ncbi:GTPase inhibitor [Tremella mesenterica]|uniref:GTPase inhibitor n=1 Tax=Tremella mesenterica TaxID=5217 RepID=A0A4Q1BIC5_TREME|nr:GTPase inhibitor [Tremella mesenterica]
MVNNHNEDTEFNDALRAHGIIPPKPPSREPSPDLPHLSHNDITHALASQATPDQLDELLEDEQLDSDDEEVFEAYRRQRMAEMRKEEKSGRFGSLMPLGREDFVKEVTEGSKQSPLSQQEEEDDDDDDDEEEDEGGLVDRKGRLRGTGVVVFLYKDSIPLSQHLRPLLQTLATAHPSTKFLSIPAHLCIPNYPDRNVPTLLVYRNGEITGNLVAGQGLNGLKTTVRELEGVLLRYKAIEKPADSLGPKRNEEEEDDDVDGESRLGKVGMVGSKASGIRNGDEEDSDYDL